MAALGVEAQPGSLRICETICASQPEADTIPRPQTDLLFCRAGGSSARTSCGSEAWTNTSRSCSAVDASQLPARTEAFRRSTLGWDGEALDRRPICRVPCAHVRANHQASTTQPQATSRGIACIPGCAKQARSMERQRSTELICQLRTGSRKWKPRMEAPYGSARRRLAVVCWMPSRWPYSETTLLVLVDRVGHLKFSPAALQLVVGLGGIAVLQLRLYS